MESRGSRALRTPPFRGRFRGAEGLPAPRPGRAAGPRRPGRPGPTSDPDTPPDVRPGHPLTCSPGWGVRVSGGFRNPPRRPLRPVAGASAHPDSRPPRGGTTNPTRVSRGTPTPLRPATTVLPWGVVGVVGGHRHPRFGPLGALDPPPRAPPRPPTTGGRRRHHGGGSHAPDRATDLRDGSARQRSSENRDRSRPAGWSRPLPRPVARRGPVEPSDQRGLGPRRSRLRAERRWSCSTAGSRSPTGRGSVATTPVSTSSSTTVR